MPNISKQKQACIKNAERARQIRLARKLGLLSAADKIKKEPQWQGQGESAIEDEDTKPSSSQLELADLDHVMAELENETEEEESIIDDYHVEVKAEPQEDPLYIESFDDGGVLFTNVDTLERTETTVKTTKRVTVASTWKSTTTSKAKKKVKPNPGHPGLPRTPFPCILCFKNTPYDLSWLENCSDKDFMAMFILKKMLQVPSEHLQEYLKQLKEPKRMLHVCKECKPVVIEAFGVQQEINILEKKLRSYQDEMRDQIKTTFHRWTKAKTPTTLMEKKTHRLRLQLTQNTRHFVKTGIWPPSLTKLLKGDNKVTPKKSAKAKVVQQSSHSKGKQGTAEAKGGTTVAWKDCVKAFFESALNAKILNNKSNTGDDCDYLQNPLSPELDCNDDSVFENQREEDPAEADRPEAISLKEISVKRCSKRANKYKCVLCPNVELLRGSQAFVEHVLYHYERPFQCSECDTFWTGNPLELENCMKGVKHNTEGLDENHRCTMGNLVKVVFKTAKIWECAHCWEKFCLETERDVHEQQAHTDKPAIELPLSCTGCSKKLRDIDDTWRLHRILEHPHLARFSCFYCNEIFKLATKEGIHVLDETALSEHIATAHNQPGRTRLRRSTYHECDVCGANCSHRNELVDHFAKCHGVHKNDRLCYSCRLCYKRFSDKHGLSLHFEVTHCRKIPQNRSAEAKRIYPKMSVNRKHAKVYVCELCPNLKIRGVESYAEHVLYHYERPYQCSQCNTFWTGNQLELEKCLEGIKHNKEGLDVNHKCTMGNLVKVVFKTGKIWECAHCWENFCLETERDAHEKQVHSDKPAIDLPLSCAGCSKMLRDTDDSWRLHRVLEHGHLDWLACFYCNQVFKLETKEGIDVLDERALRNHIAAEHNRPGCEGLRLDTLHGCDVCGANFRQRLQLVDHFTKCHGVGVDRNGELISCRVCYERLRDKHSLSLHFKIKHYRSRQEDTPGEEERIGQRISVKRACATKRKVYQCELCPNLEIQGAQSFVQHLLYHYERPYQCSECDTFCTGNPLELQNCLKCVKHSKEGLDENHRCTMGNLVKVMFKTAKIWECAHCWEKFCLETERDAHEEQVHSDKPAIELPLSCDVCSKKLRDIDESWRLHRVTEHPQLTQFACFYCNEIFKVQSKEGVDVLDEKALSEHIRAEHNTTGRTSLRQNTFYECEVCGANFSHKNLLADHFAKCHGVDDKNEKIFSCRVCYTRFRDRWTRLLHFTKKHCQNRQEYICDMCAYKTVNVPKFTEHKLKVHDIEPEDGRKIYNCTKEDCSYRCLAKSFLKKHMIKEHGLERRYKCKFCGKGFLASTHLHIHEQGIHVNANVKPYQCEICGNSFAVKTYLYIHMRLSHQNRPFASTNKKRPSKRSKKPTVSTTSLDRQQLLRPPAQYAASVPNLGGSASGEEPLAQNQLYVPNLPFH